MIINICNDNHDVSIRPIPYPYRAMLAICSDLDETPSQHNYIETMRYLNTTEITTMGQGLGLEVGNTIYFDMPPDQFSYWNADTKGRAILRMLIKSGHIDCLHSYGDLATTRAHAERALVELTKYDCKFDVWIDHGIAPSNFGKDIMRGQGDIVGSEVYHADLTTAFGIKYVWMGRVTSVIGQDVKRSLRGIWNHKHPIKSFKTFLKEYAKGLLAYAGNTKYAMHKSNQVLRETHLRNGHQILEFMRSSPHWGGISFNDRADGLSEVLTDKILSLLIKRGGISIVYNHLGKAKRNEFFSPSTKKALDLLARYSQDNKILITTTSRLLQYCRMIHDVNLSISKRNDHLYIDVCTKDSLKELAGLSIYSSISRNTHMTINGIETKNLQHNAADHTGRTSMSLPWQPLEFPKGL